MQKEAYIAEFENKRSVEWPWLDGKGYSKVVKPIVDKKTALEW